VRGKSSARVSGQIGGRGGAVPCSASFLSAPLTAKKWIAAHVVLIYLYFWCGGVAVKTKKATLAGRGRPLEDKGKRRQVVALLGAGDL
jgi:hypothetical protein